MPPITCSIVEPFVGAVNTILAIMTQFLGPLGLSAILNPLSNFISSVRGLAGCL